MDAYISGYIACEEMTEMKNQYDGEMEEVSQHYRISKPEHDAALTPYRLLPAFRFQG